MAITLYGVDPSIDETHWSRLMEMLGDGGSGAVVDNGYTPAAASGTLVVSIAAGDAVVAGVLAERDAGGNVTIAANGGGNPRVTLVCLQVDWSSTASAGGTLVTVNGTNAPEASLVDPDLTQEPGTLYQLPLARVIVRPGVGQIDADDVRDIRPLRRALKISGGSIGSDTVSGGAIKTVRTDTVTAPGWQDGYRLEVFASLNFAFTASGKGRLLIDVDDDTKRNVPAPGSNVGPVTAHWVSDVRAGSEPATVEVRMTRDGMSEDLDLQSSASYVDILVHPA